jgi:hypothetical protein
MKSSLAITAAAIAIWLASPALNSGYVPWGASGASRAFASAAAIWLISTLAMLVAFRRAKAEKIAKPPFALLITVALLVLAETAYWLAVDETNNKPMLLRQSGGNWAGFVAAGSAAVAAMWRGHSPQPQWPFASYARWAAAIIAAAVALELALFAVRTAMHRTPGYYAMDCSMFAVALLAAAIVIAALGRCIRGRRRAKPQD